MVRELLCLSLFFLAAVSGAARFRDKKSWDQVSLWVSNLANFSGTLLLASSILYDQESVSLVPLSLLAFMYGMSFLYHNYFIQIIGLPLVIAEVLLSFTFSEIRELLTSPAALMMAMFLHMLFLGIIFKLVLGLEKVAQQEIMWSPYTLASKLDRHRDRLKTMARIS